MTTKAQDSQGKSMRKPTQHLKADNTRTICGISLDILDSREGEITELPEDATCVRCQREASEGTSDPSASYSRLAPQIDAELIETGLFDTNSEIEAAFVVQTRNRILHTIADNLPEKKEHGFLCHVNTRGFEPEHCTCGATPFNDCLSEVRAILRGKNE